MRALRVTALLLLVLALAGGLAWTGVLPGGWRLRRALLGAEATATWVRERHAAQRMATFARERPPAGAVCFLGSSTVERLPLASLFPGARVVNRGVAGDTTGELLGRLDRLLPPEPAAFVLGIGANDLRREGRPPEQVARGVADVLDALAARAPDAPVALLGLYCPRAASPLDPERTRDLDRRLAALCDARALAYVPVADVLSGADGLLPAELTAPDGVHLSPAGEARLAARLLAEGGPVAELLTRGDGSPPVGGH